MGKFTKKVLITASVLSMLATSSAFAADSGKAGFSDVSANHWAKSSIEAMVAKGVVAGYPDGTFKPDSPVQADEFLKMFITALTEPATVEDVTHPGNMIETRVFTKSFMDSTDEGNRFRLKQFQDLINLNTAPANGYWATYYVSMGTTLGLVNSYNDPFLKYTDKLTREQLAYIIHNFLYYYEPVLDESFTQMAGDSFKDRGDISIDLTDDVNLAVTKGIFSGYEDGTFKPNRFVSRAESLALIDRLVNPSKRSEFKPVANGKSMIESVVDGVKSYKVTPYKEVANVAAKLKGISGDYIWTNQTVFYIYKDADSKDQYQMFRRSTNYKDWEYSYTKNPYLVNFRVDAYSYGVITRNSAGADNAELKKFADAVFGNKSQDFIDLIKGIYKDIPKTGNSHIDDYIFVAPTNVTIGGHKVSYHRNQGTVDLTFLIDVAGN